MNEKSWYASKTMWINIVTFLVALMTMLSGQEYLSQYSAEILMGVAFLNMILRSITTAPLKKKLSSIKTFIPWM